jgi:heme exporter protein B
MNQDVEHVIINKMKQILTLFKKEALIEFRLQYSFFGVLLYVASTTFVLFLAVNKPEKQVWIGLFWVILLFASVNAIAKSFLQENKGRMLYYYTITNATNFIIAKLIFNSLLMIVISMASWLLVQLLLGSPVVKPLLFFCTTILGSISFGLLFTLLSAIAAKAQQNAALMAILGFPLIIPLLLVLMKISTIALNYSNVYFPWDLLAILLGYNVLIIMLSCILYPFIWKE